MVSEAATGVAAGLSHGGDHPRGGASARASIPRRLAALRRAWGLLCQRGVEHLQRISRAFRLVFEAAPKLSVLYVGLVLVQAVLPLAVIYSFKLLVDQVSWIAGHGLEAGAVRTLWVLLGLATGANLAVLLFRSGSGLVMEAQSQIVTDRMQELLHAKSAQVDLEYYENDQYQDTLHRAQREAAFRPTRIVHATAQILQSALSLTAIGAFLLVSFHWTLGGVLLLSALPGVALRVRQARAQFSWQYQRAATERRIDYYHWMLTGPNYAKELRLFDLGTLFRQRAGELRALLRSQRLGLSTRRAVQEFFSQASAALAVFGCFAFITFQAVAGAVTLGVLVMFYQVFQRGMVLLSELLTGLTNLYENNLFLTNLYQFLDLQPKVRDPVVARSFPQPIVRGIQFERVSFRYAGTQRNVLEGIQLTIEPGEMVAIVGANGAGKSTLTKLLCRLYDPSEGHIRIDGVDLRDFPRATLQRNVSAVFQDYAHYYLSVAENIGLGRSEGMTDRAAIRQAALQAGIHERVERLPQGYDTVLGKVFAGGEELSVGEWQRLALARAFLRDAPLIILDEPSSALDPKAEFEVFQQFKELTRGKTSIVVSHRLSTVRMADRILVMEDGRITESGSHDELCQAGNRYAQMFALQAMNYR
jgi:ATP-binding cassette subfamily B protein